MFGRSLVGFGRGLVGFGRGLVGFGQWLAAVFVHACSRMRAHSLVLSHAFAHPHAHAHSTFMLNISTWYATARACCSSAVAAAVATASSGGGGRHGGEQWWLRQRLERGNTVYGASGGDSVSSASVTFFSVRVLRYRLPISRHSGYGLRATRNVGSARRLDF